METRRKFLKKTCYIAPAVLTLAVRPAHAKGPYNIGNNSGAAPKENLSRSGAQGSSGGNSSWWQFWERM